MTRRTPMRDDRAPPIGTALITTCARCDAQHVGVLPVLPAGWALLCGAPLCPDCWQPPMKGRTRG